MLTFDNDAVSGGKTRFHKPPVADGAIENERVLLDRIIRFHKKYGWISFRISGNGLLRNQDRLLAGSFLENGAYEHTR